jgi:hypothetical protein
MADHFLPSYIALYRLNRTLVSWSKNVVNQVTSSVSSNFISNVICKIMLSCNHLIFFLLSKFILSVSYKCLQQRAGYHLVKETLACWLFLTSGIAMCWAIWISKKDIVFDKGIVPSCLRVLFWGTHWIQFWSLLHKERDRLSFKASCKLHESATMEVFAAHGWSFRNRIAFWFALLVKIESFFYLRTISLFFLPFVGLKV